MAQIIFHLSDDTATKVTEAFCYLRGYQAEVQNDEGTAMVPNPLTPAQFAQRQVISDVRKVVTEYLQQIKVAELKESLAKDVGEIQVTVEVK